MSEYEPDRWRKRPVTITAQRMREAFAVETMEGSLRGKAGDWLITGVKGEQYPCDDEVFRATYEPATDRAEKVDAEKDALISLASRVAERMIRAETAEQQRDEARAALESCCEAVEIEVDDSEEGQGWVVICDECGDDAPIDRPRSEVHGEDCPFGHARKLLEKTP